MNIHILKIKISMAAASKKLPFCSITNASVKNRQFFESPGYPLLPIKNAFRVFSGP